MISNWRRVFVTCDLNRTTDCHDIFGYCFRKALIRGDKFREEIGGRYAIEGKLVNI